MVGLDFCDAIYSVYHIYCVTYTEGNELFSPNSVSGWTKLLVSIKDLIQIILFRKKKRFETDKQNGVRIDISVLRPLFTGITSVKVCRKAIYFTVEKKNET